MSYDISIGEFDGNYTYNVSKLFHTHLLSDDEQTGLQGLHGKTGAQALAVLSRGFDSIHSEYLRVWKTGDVGARSFCGLYDAPNGWGSTVGALIFLAQFMAACAANPRKKVRVS